MNHRAKNPQRAQTSGGTLNAKIINASPPHPTNMRNKPDNTYCLEEGVSSIG